MPVCQFCGCRNDGAGRNCVKCGAELPVDPDHRGTPPSEDEPSALEAEVVRRLESVGKIDAIKHYRESTGAGLKEAKDAVEKIAARLGVEVKSGTGCVTVLAALIALLSLLTTGWIAGAGQ